MNQIKPGYNYLQMHDLFFDEIPHPRAISLARYEFFWNILDGLGPFGTEESYLAFCELCDWLKFHPKTPIIECFIWILESWDLTIDDFDDRIIEEENILKIIYDLDFNEELMMLDLTIISTGFGQLILQGKIDEDIKNIIQLSILRQMNSHVLDTYLGDNEEWKYIRYMYLQKLLEILEEA